MATYCQYKHKHDRYWTKDFSCREEARTGSIFCIFHDEKYVKDNYEKFEREATKRFEDKVRYSSDNDEPLECIGYFLPAIEFAKYFPTTTVKEESFSQPVNFVKVTFYGLSDFTGATFSNTADFNRARFSRGYPLLELHSLIEHTFLELHSLIMYSLLQLHSPMKLFFLKLDCYYAEMNGTN